MDDQAFFHALDLELPDLADVKAAVAQQDWSGARKAFATHLKQRKEPRWYIDWRERPESPTPPEKPSANQRIADEAVRQQFTVCGIPHQFEGEINWEFNPTDDPNSEFALNHEWTWQFSRHSFWQSLGRAYWETGNEAYAKAFVEQMAHWVANNPVPEGKAQQSPFSRWRTIEAGIRMGHTWPDAFYLALSSPSFPDEAIVTMVRSTGEHARYLRQHPTQGNWLTMEMNGLYTVGALFPEFREANDWRTFAAQRCREELDTQVYPDGAQKELAPGYHWVALLNLRSILRLAEWNDLDLPGGYKDGLERMYAYPMWLMMPGDGLPAFNDSGWGGGVRTRAKEGFNYFPQRSDFQWIATNGAEGAPPEHTSYALPYAGYIVQRSGWDDQARYLAFDAGPFGTGHQHEDKLNFVLQAYGRRFVTEGGIYMYDASQWRRYVLGPYAHNVVFVDGQGQHRRGLAPTYQTEEPLPFIWEATDGYDYAQASYGSKHEGFGDEHTWIATHTRRILFVKNGAPSEKPPGDFWIVCDTLWPQDDAEHTYESVFHLDTEEVSIDEEARSVVTQFEEGPNFGIFPLANIAQPARPMDVELIDLTIIKGQEEPFVQGWIPKNSATLTGVRPIATPTFTAKGTGPKRFVYVLYPVPEGPVPNVTVDIWPLQGNSPTEGISANIRFPSGPHYRVFFPEDHDREWLMGAEPFSGPVWLAKFEENEWRVVAP